MDIRLLADNYFLSIFITDPIKRGTADILYRSEKTVLALQGKLGLNLSEGFIYWAF